MKHLATLIVFMLAFVAHTHAEESQKKDRVGPGKAVLEASEERGLRLAPATLKLLDIKTKPLETVSTISLSVSSLVYFQDFTAIYRERDGWLQMVEIEGEVKGDNVSFATSELQLGDKVVTQNASLLRVIDLDIFGPEADACAD